MRQIRVVSVEFVSFGQGGAGRKTAYLLAMVVYDGPHFGAVDQFPLPEVGSVRASVFPCPDGILSAMGQ